ncbi:hypothetical protein LXL04_014308 [Taraxacum kok-saghyz]
MCSPKSKLVQPTQVIVDATQAANMVSDMNGRQVLQPATSNRVLAKCSPKKSLFFTKSPSIPPVSPPPNSKPTISPNLRSPRQPAVGNDHPDCINSGTERLLLTPPTKCTTQKSITPVKKSTKIVGTGGGNRTDPNSLVVKYSSAAIVDSPGSIAAARREQVAAMLVQRKMKIAHYGRSKTAKYDGCRKLTSSIDPDSLTDDPTTFNVTEEKRCSFITPNSDPIYVGYHDEEWGVPVHDDKLLFELLVLTGAQVGSDWTSVLKKRQRFREAFSGFEAEIITKFTEKTITSTSSDYGIEVGLIRGVVQNSNCVLEIKKTFGSFNKYIWGFVNHKPIATHYKVNHKIPAKTSKSEAISRDMLRRGFRQAATKKKKGGIGALMEKRSQRLFDFSDEDDSMKLVEKMSGKMKLEIS